MILDVNKASTREWWTSRILAIAPEELTASEALASLVRYIVALEERIRILEDNDEA